MQVPPLRWQTLLFVTANLVLLSALLFDPLLGRMAGKLAPPVHIVGRFLTDIGKSGWILCVGAFLFFEGWAISRIMLSPKGRCQAARMSWIGFYLLATVSLSGLLANLLKRLIGRARPMHFQEWGAFGFNPLAGDAGFESFPSGHATTIGALFAVLALLMPGYRTIFMTCGLWLAMTRMMVGAHYPSDIIAGFALGAWFSFMTAIVFSHYGLVFRASPNGYPLPRQTYPAAGQ